MPPNEQRKRPPVWLLFLTSMPALLAGCRSAPTVLPGCARPAPKNPSLPLTVDPSAYGRADASGLTAMAFSQVGAGERDPQVLELAPDIVIRGWQRWDRWGLTPAEYDGGYLSEVHARKTVFVGGSTASALFRDEAASEEEFRAQVACDTRGQPIRHDAGDTSFFRASLASPAYRQRLIDLGKMQIDLGADGLFYDEVSSSYDGARWDGNEGFDDAHVADFGGFLCERYAALDAPARDAKLGLQPGELDCAGDAPVRGRSFDYRAYLSRNGWLDKPLATNNPLAAAWGRTLDNRPDPAQGTFVQVYPSMVYWQQVVVAVRSYAREVYQRELYVTSNGIYPFVDFQSVGLYDYNRDGAGGAEVDYVPVARGHLDGTASLLPNFLRLAARSARIAGAQVPVVLFLDWPTPTMDRYYALPLSERQDYFRIFAAEAYAAGLFYALPLRTSMPNDPTAAQLGMMPFFAALQAFYRGHASLYHGAQALSDPATVSHAGVATHLTRLADGRTVLHMVNHNYDRAVQRLSGVTASFPTPQAPSSVTLVSPDRSADMSASFGYQDGRVTVDVGQLDAYLAVVVK
jgi:hypothetical protein